jgi:hypothetical protein
MSTYDCSPKGHQHSFSIPYETYFLILNSSTLKCPGMERIFHIYILTIMESLVYASLFLKRTYNLTNDWEHLPSSSICISIYEEFIFESCWCHWWKKEWITSITYLQSQSSMRIYNSDIVKHQTLELKPASTTKLDRWRFCSNPTVCSSQIINRTGVCLRTNSIISGVDMTSCNKCIIRILYIYPIIIRWIKVTIYGNVRNVCIKALYYVQTAITKALIRLLIQQKRIEKR